MAKNRRSFEPVTIFLILILITIAVSYIGYLLNWQGTYERLNLITGASETTSVMVENLFSVDGLQFLIANATRNFASFAPLVSIIIAFMGIGIIEKSGLFHALFGRLKEAPLRTITFVVILLSVIFSVFNDVGFVLVMPLAALVFLLVGRNPIAGIIASFAGVTGGASINLFISSLDFNLSDYTNAAAQLIDPAYVVNPNSNWYLIILATILITIAATIITEKFVIPRLGEYKKVEEIELDDEPKIGRGLIFSGIASTIYLGLIVYMIVPIQRIGGGVLLDRNEEMFLNQLLGYNSFFSQGITFILAFLLIIAGLFYGIGAKTIRNDKQFVTATNSAMKDISRILVLMFFVAQFIALYRKSNIGTLINVNIVNLIESLNFSGLALVILIFLAAAIGNLFLTSTTATWSIMAPVVVPVAMMDSITPEFTQAIFRAGDSVTNGLTPLLVYFVVYIALIQKYNLAALKETSYIKSLKMIIPYTLAFTFVWLVILISWYYIGLPIGPGVFPNI